MPEAEAPREKTHAVKSTQTARKVRGIVKTMNSRTHEAKEQGKSLWWRWLDRFASYYDRKFGPDWQIKDKEFWKKFDSWE